MFQGGSIKTVLFGSCKQPALELCALRNPISVSREAWPKMNLLFPSCQEAEEKGRSCTLSALTWVFYFFPR